MNKDSDTKKGEQKPKDYSYELVKDDDPVLLMIGKLIGNNGHLSGLLNNQIKIGAIWKLTDRGLSDSHFEGAAMRVLSEWEWKLIGFQGLVVVNKKWWSAPERNDRQREAAVLNALLGIEVQMGNKGEPKLYPDGETVVCSSKAVKVRPEVLAQFGGHNEASRHLLECAETFKQQKLFEEPEPTKQEQHEEAVAA